MTVMMNRRQLIQRGLMAGTGLVLLKQLDNPGRRVFAATEFQRDADRLAADYQRLDE